MDLKTLKTFQLIVKHESFIRAANEMNYAQSTVTMQIQKLEDDLGVQLIERGQKKTIRLTEAGRLFYEQSLDIVQRMEQLQSTMKDLQQGEAGSIRIGVVEPTASYRVPRILKRFLLQYPKVRVSVDIANTPTLSERLLTGDIDLALCSAPDLGSDLLFEPLFQEEFVLLLPENHPLAQKEIIKTHDFHGQRLLITSKTCPYRKRLELVLEMSSTSVETMEIGSMTALKDYVACGLGIALVPKIMLDPVPQGTTYRRLGESRVDMTIGFLFKTSQLPLPFAALNMYECFKQALLEHTGDRIAETLPHVTESGPYDYKDCLDARSLTRISTP